MTTFPLETTEQHALVVVPVVLIVLASICVGLRFRARKLQRAKLLLEDWLCLLTLVAVWGFQGINISLAVNTGAGLDFPEVMMRDPTVMILLPKLLLANFILWMVIVTLVQLCVMVFLLRIFGISTIFRYSAWALTAAILGLGIAGTLSQIFKCNPIRKAWMPMVPGTCLDPDTNCRSFGLIHVIFDLLMVLLPMPMVWNLKTAVRNKVVISVLLGLGLLATIVSFLKLECITGYPHVPQENMTKYISFPLLMQTIELPIGLICCCIPCLKPAWKEIRFVSSSAASRLLSFTGASDTGRSTSNFKSDLQTNESTKNFVSLHDGASDNDSVQLGNRAGARGNDIELGESKEGAQNIHVVQSYSIRR